MSITLLIGGVDTTSLVVPKSLRISESISGRNTLRVEMRDPNQSYHALLGNLVECKDAGGDTIFKGTIDKVSEEEPGPQDTMNRIKIDAVDFNQLADRFLVAKYYVEEGQTLGDILEDIVTVETPLSLEGVTLETPITGDPPIEAARFDYKTATKVFDDLARENGYVWNIDYEKVLTFSPLGSIASGLEFKDSGVRNYTRCTVSRTREKYRNRQFLRGEKQPTDSRVETFVGDGENRTFLLSFEHVNDDSVPIVKVQGTAKTVGVLGNESGLEFDFYFSPGRKEISSDISSDPVPDGYIVSVTYTGQFPFITEVELTGQVDERKDIESGSGIYENLESDSEIHGIQLALNKATSYLTRFGKLPMLLRVESRNGSARCGESVAVDLAIHGITESDFLVERKLTSETKEADGTLTYSYRLTSPPEEFESWREFYQRLFDSGRRVEIGRVNELLLISRSSTDSIDASDSHSQSGSTSSLIDHNQKDAFTAFRIGFIDGKPSGLIGSALIGPHNED